MKILTKIANNIDAIGIFVFMFCVFSYIMFILRWNGSDLCVHAEIAQEMLDKHRLLSTNFLMYFMANLLTLFSGYKNAIRVALVLLISLSNTAKYIIVREAFEEWTTNKIAKLSSASLLFVYIIPLMYFLSLAGMIPVDNHMYLGYYVPNVWHNSTILCMMPFAIATYLLSVKQFDVYSDARNRYITLWLALSVLVKPSFFFIYVVAYPLIILSRYGLKIESLKSMFPLLIGGLCLIYEYITLYYHGGNDGSGVVVNIAQLGTPEFWRSHILSSYFLVSFALPILFVLIYGHTIIQDREFWFVLLMMACGLGIMWCCLETGPRAYDGNFDWQAICAMWFVYYYMLKNILAGNSASSAKMRWAQIFMQCIFGIHVLMGCLYLAKYIVFKNYF